MQKDIGKGDYLDILLRSNKTIFSTKDAALLWSEKNIKALRVRLSYYVKTGKLIRLHRGIYVKDKNYDKLELAVKIYNPSYISFETILAKGGAVFQFYGQIFIASYLTREVSIDGQTYSYRRIRDSILTNQAGIETKNGYQIASPERAFLDIVFLNKNYYFDNLSPLNWDKVFEILPIYKNKSMVKRIKKYLKSFHETK